MNTARGLSPVIDAYLDELDAATAHLPSDERHEIRTSIADHISDRLSTRPHITDEDAREVLRELGPVSAIVPADASLPHGIGSSTTAGTSESTRGSRGLIAGVLGILALVLFPLVPIGILLGVVAVVLGFLSRRGGERGAWPVVGIVLGALAIVLPAVVLPGLISGTSGSSSDTTPVSSYSAVPYDSSASATSSPSPTP